MATFFADIPVIPNTNSSIMSDECQKDEREKKINASIGMIFNEQGKLKELPFISEVEKEIFEKQLDKEYSTLLGLPEFNKSVFELFFPKESYSENFFCTQSATGGSALRIGSDILRKYFNPKIHISNLSFQLYDYLFSECSIERYPYYNAETKSLDFEALVKYLTTIPEKSVINLQVCNHNPTGLDLCPNQWDKLSEIFAEKKHFAYFDCAYLGYSSGSFQKDLYGVYKFLEKKNEFFLAYSSAKNTLNYSDDVGALVGWLKDPKTVKNILTNLAIINRSYFSFSSLQGARIVSSILNSRKNYLEKEINDVVVSLELKRKEIVDGLTNHQVDPKLTNLIKNQKGIYLFLDLSEEEVAKLRNEYAIYVCENGRVNLTAINKSNISYFIDSIINIYKKQNN